MSTYVHDLKRKPKDMDRFVPRDAAVKILRRIAIAVETSSPDTLWHFSIRMRVATPKRKK